MTDLNAYITGIGMSQIGRMTNRSAMSLLAEATREALGTSGLSRSDIDGLTTFPGRASHAPGMSPLGCTDAREGLGLKTRWHSSSSDGPAQMSPIMIAAMAVSTGMARHVLCFRALTESSSQTKERRASIVGSGGGRLDGVFQWLVPMGAMSASNWTAMFATRYMHEFDLTKEDLGTQCVLQREYASGNERAVFRDRSLTMEDYLGARMVSSPLGLYDCDIPIDGACVVIVSSGDGAQETARDPIRIAAMGAALRGRDSWDQRADLTTMAAHDAAAEMWRQTALTPDDIDVAAVYDGFSIYVPMWLEAFGFCEHGAAGRLIREGATHLDGRIPTNTGGGQLSAGRLHGFGHVHESCVQLWGLGGKRQVRNATRAVCGVGGGPLAGAILLERQAG